MMNPPAITGASRVAWNESPLLFRSLLTVSRKRTVKVVPAGKVTTCGCCGGGRSWGDSLAFGCERGAESVVGGVTGGACTAWGTDTGEVGDAGSCAYPSGFG